VSRDLEGQMDVERRQLRRLLETHAGLLAKCRAREPTVDELAALAAILHAFYNGVENIFKRVSMTLNGGPPTGPFWHADLIEAMSKAKPNRPALLSESLSETLQEYLDFRHVFRQAYSFELRWKKMKHLVLGLHEVLRRLEHELDVFLAHLKNKVQPPPL
jgi:hypothetical protein